MLAIWPNSPGPCEPACGGAAACAGGGAAMLVAGRVCWYEGVAGLDGATEGREGARPPPPPPDLRGIATEWWEEFSGER